MTLQEAWSTITAAIAARAWYPLIAVALWLVLQIAKNRMPQWLPKVPDGWKFVVPLSIAAVTGFVDGWQSSLTWKASLLRAGYAVFALALPAMGFQGATKESVLGGIGMSLLKAEEKKDPPKPPILPLILLCLVFLPSATCAQAKPIIRTVNDIAADWCAAHYSQKNGVSVDDALKTFCASESALRPWLDVVLAGQKSGVERAGVAQHEPECEVTVTKDVAADAGKD